MPDFNKGDNTQQGMNGEGWVWGGLDLNRKRLIFVAVTSDEEDEGLDSVYLKVHDDLNNLDYIVTGENLPVGESTIGSGGGLDNKKLTINFIESSLSSSDLNCAIPILSDKTITYAFPTLSNEDKTVEFIIPEGAPAQPWVYTVGSSFSTFTGSNAVNCRIIEDNGDYAVSVTDPTADASITIKAVSGVI